jgi:glyoxylase-like metal-dependent hydrolase (beta-lactamase superfamily II)
MGGLAMAPWSVRRAFGAVPRGETVLTKPFARVEKLAEGVWATIATPFDSQDFTAVSNGGIIAGRDGVMLVEGLNTRAGGSWLATLAKELTGRWPTHVVVTHLHGDHTNGVCGCMHPDHQTAVISSAGTRRLLASRAADDAEWKFDEATRRAVLGATQVIPETIVADDAGSTTIDLGGRTVTLETRIGHTPSDLTIRIDNPRILWCGDLVFHGMWPYFGDAIPSKLGATCRAMLADADTAYIPGHGSVANSEELRNYIGVLDHLEAAARDAHAKGIPAAEAYKTYVIPASLGEWRKFREDVFRFGFEAWERELKGS